MNFSAAWLPRSVEALRTYNSRTFLSDLIAGVTVGLVALPLAMALAISSGLTPQQGIYCAVVTGFLISALGGSRTQIGGPTGAFVVVVFGIVEKYGVGGLYVVTFMAGVLILLLGLTGLGTAVRFIPRPVIVGFTNGIALLIASTQIKDFFGLQLVKVPGEFFERMEALLGAAHTASAPAIALGAAALATIVIVMKFVPRVPGYIVALVGGTVATALLSLPVETIGSRFGGIPAGLPKFHMISLSVAQIVELMQPAVTVALLGAIESLMSAVVADRMSNDQHNPNTELVAQGIANMISPMFGGLPATGAIARTATNIRSGAKTPVAGIIHALTLLVVILVAAPLAKFVPMPVLAAILFVVAYNMGEWREIPEILKLAPTEIAVWFVTFALTVVADLTLAVQVGMISAALLYIKKVTQTTTVSEVTTNYVDDGWVHILQGKEIPEYLRVFRIHGPFLFGSTDKLKVIRDQIDQLPEIVALRLRNMTAIDGTGLKALEDLADALHGSGRELLLCGAREQPARLLEQSDVAEHLGRENVVPHIKAALERAAEIHAKRDLGAASPEPFAAGPK
ncbi:MAG: SulP family inorganic anion transporter [Acidobacteriota bacterium]